VAGDFELTTDELRVVARYVAETASEVLPLFEAAVPDDPRPRLALDAAWEFVGGARRTKLQRVTSLDAHRAAAEAPSEASRLAARSAGDAASTTNPTANTAALIRQTRQNNGIDRCDMPTTLPGHHGRKMRDRTHCSPNRG
jgi:hypothetical protein